MIITITGDPSSGNSYIARHVAQELGFRHYSVGDLRRNEALNRELSLAEFNALNEDTDTMFDEQQKQLGVTKNNFVIDGKLSWYFIPHSFKVFVTASEDVRAKRMITKDEEHERIGEGAQDILEAKKLLKERVLNDVKRYKKRYGINPYEQTHYDLVLDTTQLSKEESVQKVLDAYQKSLKEN